jgi:hypothetical protein
MINDEWERRLGAVRAELESIDEADYRARVDALIDELPAGDPVGLYERGGAFDSTGHPDRAVPLYREALAAGLSGLRRRQATISLASSLRNLGEPAAGVELLTTELAAGSDSLDDAVRGFLALCLVEVGREREALGVALTALAPHVPRYRRSLTHYAHDLTEPTPAD